MQFRLFYWTENGLLEGAFVGSLAELGAFIRRVQGPKVEVTWELESTLERLGLA